MKLELFRIDGIRVSEKSTMGELWVDGRGECYTLEDKRREPGEPKIPGKTAIPEGEYKIILDFSNRFQRIMPHILNVPNFEGIRIHAGNTEADTAGCILVGLNRAPDWVGQNRIAFNRLMAKLQDATQRHEGITIKVVYNPVFT